MSIESAADLAAMERAGRTVALILQEMTAAGVDFESYQFV